ncbi:DUF2283 domain-containing protein [Candidatus Kaiserbacteria bacterium]|nr:DUF2283 domain-containing protein [Candidatus Kaiserbacteria bacterium]
MDIKYDIMADAVYVNVGSGKIAKTIKTEERFLVDVDAQGNVVGIEILDASSQQELVENLKKNAGHGAPITIETSTPIAA